MNMGPTNNVKVFNFIIIVILIIVENSIANGKYDLGIKCKLNIYNTFDCSLICYNCFVLYIIQLFF